MQTPCAQKRTEKREEEGEICRHFSSCFAEADREDLFLGAKTGRKAERIGQTERRIRTTGKYRRDGRAKGRELS